MILLRSWWVFAFVLLCLAGYDLAASRQDYVVARLERQKEERLARLSALKEWECSLECRISSQSDPLYVELMLMRELGVVSEGQVKVYFKQ